MMWDPPLSPSATTALVLLALAAMALSFLWPRRQLDPLSPAGAASIALRLVAFLLLLFLLLQPSRLPRPQKVEARRTLAVLIDTSASMDRPDAGGDTRLGRVRRLLEEHRVLQRIEEKANLALYAFDARPAPLRPAALPALDPQGRATDLAATVDQAVRLHPSDDLAGLLVLTDGRVTQGEDPRAMAQRHNVPLFLLAVGEAAQDAERPESELRDLAIDAVSAEPRIILGRSAQIAVSVRSQGYEARQVSVELLQDERVVATTAVALSPQQPRRQALFNVRPTQLGEHAYRVRVPVEPDESNPANNVAGFTVEVVDPVNRLVYLDRLRSERRFLKPVIASQRNLRHTAVVQQDEERVLVEGNDPEMRQEATNLSPEQLAGLKAVILGDLPAAALTQEQIASLAEWVDRGGALLLLAGPSSLGAEGFARTPLAQVLPVTVPQGDPSEVYVEAETRVRLTPEGASHPAFQRVRYDWSQAPPLLSRVRVESVKPAATVLMATSGGGGGEGDGAPIVVTHNYGHGKVGVLLTDSTWRWQLGYDPSAAGAAAGPQSPHAVFWGQMIDWLLPDLEQADPQAGQVQLIADKGEYEVGDAVVLLASVRSSDGSPISGAQVDFTIATPDGRPIERRGEFDGAAYTATSEAAYEGQYEAHATARLGERVLGSDQVQVRVIQPVIELTNTEPDRALLRDLARLSGGMYLEPAQLGDIVALARLEPREVLVQPSAERDAMPVWDRWWLLAAFVGLMASEWFVRRRNQWV